MTAKPKLLLIAIFKSRFAEYSERNSNRSPDLILQINGWGNLLVFIVLAVITPIPPLAPRECPSELFVLEIFRL